MYSFRPSTIMDEIYFKFAYEKMIKKHRRLLSKNVHLRGGPPNIYIAHPEHEVLEKIPKYKCFSPLPSLNPAEALDYGLRK